jgi:hypothetical protein
MSSWLRFYRKNSRFLKRSQKTKKIPIRKLVFLLKLTKKWKEIRNLRSQQRPKRAKTLINYRKSNLATRKRNN